jgi:hypothetical protein
MKIFLEGPKLNDDYDEYAVSYDKETNTLYLALRKVKQKTPFLIAFEGDGITELKDLLKLLSEAIQKKK